MNVKWAWYLGYTGRGVLVAVVDDGVNMKHTALNSNFVSLSLKHLSHEPGSDSYRTSYPGFCSMKRLGVLLLLLDGMIFHRR